MDVNLCIYCGSETIHTGFQSICETCVKIGWWIFGSENINIEIHPYDSKVVLNLYDKKAEYKLNTVIPDNERNRLVLARTVSEVFKEEAKINPAFNNLFTIFECLYYYFKLRRKIIAGEIAKDGYFATKCGIYLATAKSIAKVMIEKQ